MKSILNFLFVIIILAALTAAITNPDKDEFVDYVESEYVQSSSESFLGKTLTLITKGIVGSIADQATRKNLVLFSIYEFGDNRYLGIYGNFVVLEG